MNAGWERRVRTGRHVFRSTEKLEGLILRRGSCGCKRRMTGESVRIVLSVPSRGYRRVIHTIHAFLNKPCRSIRVRKRRWSKRERVDEQA